MSIGSSRDSRWVPKQRVRVELTTTDGQVRQGHIFVSPDMRALDVLNAFQQFLPFESLDGEFEIVAKATIARIKPFDKPKQPRRRAGEKAGHLAPVD